MKKFINEQNLRALIISAFYFVFGFFWVLLSDELLYELASSHSMYMKMQTYKGWFFIFLTSILIFTLVRYQLKIVVDLNKKLRANEMKFRRILDLSHDVIWTVDNDGIITFINQACKQVYGYPPEQMIGRPFKEFIDEEVFYHNQSRFRENLNQGFDSMNFQTEIVNDEGQKVYMQDNITVIRDESGKIIEIVGSSKDITSTILYEKELLAANERLETALVGGNLGLWDYNLEEGTIYINEMWKKITGYYWLGDEILDRSFLTMIHPDDAARMENQIKKLLDEGIERFSIDIRMQVGSGNWNWMQLNARVIPSSEQTMSKRIVGTIQDITSRKQLELDLQYWLENYRNFISYANEGIFMYELEEPVDPTMPEDQQIRIFFHKGYIKTCNRSFAAMYGYDDPAMMEGFRLVDLQGGDNDPVNVEFQRKFIRSGYRLKNELTIDQDKNQRKIFISNNLVGLFENNKLVRIWGSQFDITQQIITQKKVEESEYRYRQLFETNPVALILLSLEKLSITDANTSALNLFGKKLNELLNLPITYLRPDFEELSPEKIRMQISHELNKTIEASLRIDQNRVIRAEIKTAPIDPQHKDTCIVAINDITLLREAEKIVLRSLIEGEDRERRRVAGEIHDSLGQNLTAASLNFNAVKSLIDQLDDPRKEKFALGLSFLNSAIDESRNIAMNLMPRAIDDFGLIPALQSLFTRISKAGNFQINFYENIKSNYRIPRNLELTLYRISQEALNNVLKHARAQNVYVQLLLHQNELILTFEDDGVGFEFSESSPVNKGMGLLSISNRVKAMSGLFEIDSKPGKGTVLTIRIPLE